MTTYELFWVLPEPEVPDENGEIPWSEALPDGSMLLGKKHVATGKFRAMTWDDFWTEAQKSAKP